MGWTWGIKRAHGFLAFLILYSNNANFWFFADFREPTRRWTAWSARQSSAGWPVNSRALSV
jgi:hypothetical protein